MTQPQSSEQSPPADAARSRSFELDPAAFEDLKTLIKEDQQGMVQNIAADLYPADMALLLTRLPLEEARLLFSWLPVEQAGDTLAELEEERRVALLQDMRPRQLQHLLDELETDDAADVLAELPDQLAHEVLPTLEDAHDVSELMGYGVDTAGGLMAREHVAVPLHWTAAEATEAVRAAAQEVEEVYTVFVIDEEERLRGVVSLKQLLLSPAEHLISEIMTEDVITVTPEVDQEEVGRIMQRYDLVSLPVVDRLERLMGRITIDDIVDVIREEAEEDIQLISGAPLGEDISDSPLRVSRGRLPWLVLGLVGTLLAALVVTRFEATLEQAVVLASFIPIMTAMAGNAAIQSAAITLQGLASGRLWGSDMYRQLGREVLVALVNGFALSLLLCLAVVLLGLGEGRSLRLAMVTSLALFIVVVLATTNGALFPLLLNRMGIDPATAMGPFVTTSNDILGLTVYFLIATTLYL